MEKTQIVLPDRVIDTLFQAAGVSTYHPDGDQLDKLHAFAHAVTAEVLARLPVAAAPGAVQEPVRYELRMCAEGQCDDWKPVSKERYETLTANGGDAGDGLKFEGRALYAAPVAAAAPEWTDEQIIALLASLGIDADKSKYGFPELQVHTTVPGVREILRKAQLAAAAPAAVPEPNWKAFALAVLVHSREYLGCDLDGAMVQDAASEHGLLDDTLVSEPCGEDCACAEFGAFPTSCYRYSPAVLQALADK